MKTPRELLLSKHQSAQPKLDLLREEILAGLSRGPADRQHTPQVAPERMGWLQLLRAMRWHLAGLSAVWVFIAILKLSDPTTEPTAVAQANKEPPATAVALLKENRRQIMELGEAPLSSIPAMAPASPKSRRSCIQTDWAYS